ncbi:MAG: cupredoxin domain-containing protein [Acidimicrobiales bacterium]|nr:cupredoxin domain-containing protein [Acidimicrobiales bacterium]
MTVDQKQDESTLTVEDTAPRPAPQTHSVASPPAKSGTTFETLAVVGFIFGMFAIVAAVFAVGLAARAVSEANGSGGGGGSSESAATTGGGGAAITEVTLGDFFIKPKDATVKAGSVLTVKNEGSVDHDLAIEDTKSSLVAPGKETTFDLEGLKPGTYTWHCTVPGHEAAGMKGEVTVK